ncbi:MAG: hypothetical protein IT210_01135 [Armatimonadetes bacterium]|nr:hypothetical protein [Armatimonadota bacterium]
MSRSLSDPLLELPAPEGLRAIVWRLETESGQARYLSAKNLCFLHAPTSLAELRFFLASPLWAGGASLTAFDGENVVGSVMAYWDSQENERTGLKTGYTEEIFVLPGWRKKASPPTSSAKV